MNKLDNLIEKLYNKEEVTIYYVTEEGLKSRVITIDDIDEIKRRDNKWSSLSINAAEDDIHLYLNRVGMQYFTLFTCSQRKSGLWALTKDALLEEI